MDYFAHIAWSYIVFNKLKKVKWAIFFGILPDNLSWMIYFIYSLFTKGFGGPPELGSLPSWIHVLYGLSHSLFVSFFVILLLFVIYRKLIVFVLAWPLHIFFDIFTHSREFLPTPFLWPFFDFKFDGVSWGTPLFMLINWSAIIIFLIIIRRRK